LLWLTESPVVRLLSFFRLSQFAVMLLDHIGSFQQLVKSPLVENWFVLFVGHVFLRTCGRLAKTGDPLPGVQAYFSAIPPPGNLFAELAFLRKAEHFCASP